VQPSATQVRVFLVDDHEVVRRGVAEVLEDDPGITVVGEAGTVADAVTAIPETCPDVAVLDVRLPDGNGVELCREVRSRQPGLGCLMLTSFSDDEALIDSIMAGASGYVLKQIRGGELIDAVRKVAAGQSLLDPVVAARVLDRVRRGDEADELLGRLTPQERKILDLVGQGLTNRQIADNMYLAEKTVKNYVSNLLTKMGMQRRTEAAAYIARHGERSSRRYDA
jgi:two-component system, NarL family, response regulator DevR